MLLLQNKIEDPACGNHLLSLFGFKKKPWNLELAMICEKQFLSLMPGAHGRSKGGGEEGKVRKGNLHRRKAGR